MCIRLLLVDDHAAFRASLARLLALRASWSSVTAFASAEAALESIAAAVPDLVVTDVQMPGLRGIELARVLSQRVPALPVLALSSHDAPAFVEAMHAAGAAGYMLKDDPFDELVHAIREVAAGRRYLSRVLASANPGLARKF